MSEIQELFRITELNRLSCRCSQCKTELLFDVKTAAFKGAACPSCGSNLYPLAQVLEAYQSLYKEVVRSKLDIRLLTDAIEKPLGSELGGVK
jgi:DNA-directed RNA polymerase subunit RPC12/RpoP